jgi:nucleoside diphosphate kinase
MVKPKAVSLGLTEVFFSEFEKKGLVLVWRKRARLTRREIEFLYRPYRYAHWFEEFVGIMTGDDCILAIWMGSEDIIELTFEIRERIRREYRDRIEFYDLHAADSESIATSQLKFLIGRKVYAIRSRARKELWGKQSC